MVYLRRGSTPAGRIFHMEIFSGNLFPAVLAGKFFRLPFWHPGGLGHHVSKCKEIPEVAEILDVRFLTRSVDYFKLFKLWLKIEKEGRSKRPPIDPMLVGSSPHKPPHHRHSF